MAGERVCGNCRKIYLHDGCFERHVCILYPDYGRKTMPSLLKRENASNSGAANAHAAAGEPS